MNSEFLLAADLGRVAVAASWNSEFLLAAYPGRVAGSAARDAEFSLVEDPGFSLHRRGCNLLGSWREASWGGVFS